MLFSFSGFVELDEIHVPAIEIVMNETSIHSSFLVIYVGPLIPQGCGPGGFSRRGTSSIQNKGSSPQKAQLRLDDNGQARRHAFYAPNLSTVS
jgi:hypothetical protein